MYADSSALVKLVIEEPESEDLGRYVASGVALATSRVALVEVGRATAVANRAPEVRSETELLFGSCMLINITDALLRRAAELVAYDQRLASAAAEAGLAVASPGSRTAGS